MFKNITKLEITVNDKNYQLLCDQDSPLDHVKEALFQFLKFIGQIEDNIKNAQAQAKTDENKIESIENSQQEIM